MATCVEVITAAARRAGVIDRRRSIDSSDAGRLLELLEDQYLQWAAAGMFGRLTDVLVEDDYTAEEQERVVVNTASSVVVTMPATVDDDLTGDTRPPKSMAMIMVTSAYSDFQETCVYDAGFGNWVKFENLTLGGYAPLSATNKTAVVAALAVKVCDEYGLPVSTLLTREHGRGMLALTGGYAAERVESGGSYF